MRRPHYLELMTLTSFEWDDKLRSSVCTHSEHQAYTIKILQSLCINFKIVETYRHQHAPKFSKGKMEWCANGSTDQCHLRMWHPLRTGQNIGQAPSAFCTTDICAIKVFKPFHCRSRNYATPRLNAEVDLCDQKRWSKVTGLSDLMILFIDLGFLYCKQTQRAFNVLKNTLNWLKIDSVDHKFNWLECGNFSHLVNAWNAWHWESHCVFTAGSERVNQIKLIISADTRVSLSIINIRKHHFRKFYVTFCQWILNWILYVLLPFGT
jgi:hypothetical protein